MKDSCVLSGTYRKAARGGLMLGPPRQALVLYCLGVAKGRSAMRCAALRPLSRAAWRVVRADPGSLGEGGLLTFCLP